MCTVHQQAPRVTTSTPARIAFIIQQHYGYIYMYMNNLYLSFLNVRALVAQYGLIPGNPDWIFLTDQLADMQDLERYNTLWCYMYSLPFWRCTQGQKTSQFVRTENWKPLRAWLVSELSAPAAYQWRAPQTELFHARVEEKEGSTYDREKRQMGN